MPEKPASGIFNSLKKYAVKQLTPDNPPAGDADNASASGTPHDNTEYRINDAVAKKVKTVIDDFIEAAPLIEAAGFRIKDLQVELGVIPKLIPHFEKLTQTSEARRLELIEQVKGKKIIVLLLKALYKADNFQQSINMGSLDFAGIEIEITAIPAVRLIYKNPNTTRLPINKNEN